MRYLGKEYTGKGISIAIVDSGIDVNDPRLAGVDISGWGIQLGATGHALLSSQFNDENGHGTEIAVAVHHMAPDAKLLAVKIMGKPLSTSADLMAAGIETSARKGAQVVNLSLGTPNQSKALRLLDCLENAVAAGAVVLAAGHPEGKRAYPADIPTCIGVAAHRDCPIDKYFYFSPKRFPKKQWKLLSNKFLTRGWEEVVPDGRKAMYRGSGVATAYLSGTAACLAEMLIEKHGKCDAKELRKILTRTALVPIPEIGYS